MTASGAWPQIPLGSLHYFSDALVAKFKGKVPGKAWERGGRKQKGKSGTGGKLKETEKAEGGRRGKGGKDRKTCLRVRGNKRSNNGRHG